MTQFLISGTSNHEGIIFYSNNYYIEVKTFPRIEIGEVKPLEKEKERKFSLRIESILIILSFSEIFRKDLGLQIANMAIGLSNLFRTIVILYLIASFVLIIKLYGFKSFAKIRINHGAEHKVIEAYNNGKIESADKFERFSIGCGSNLVLPVLLFIVLGNFILYPYTIALTYIVGFQFINKTKGILFKIVGKPMQYLVTAEPMPEILNAAKEGLSKLIYEEEVRSVANWCSKRNRIDLRREIK